jgi:hypothetical protein
MNEKEAIERYTAEGFLKCYNIEFGSSYKVVEFPDAPDVKCKDETTGSKLNLEITLTEDRKGDIQARLSRSNSRDSEKGSETSHLPEDVIPIVIERIQSKLNKDYGENVALVVRDTSGVDWNWNYHIDFIKKSLDLRANNFDKGIWIINNSKSQIIRVI